VYGNVNLAKKIWNVRVKWKLRAAL
jgi:hypothetical protein